MFNLTNIEGNVLLKCELVGYQFPESQNDDWCLLKVSVTQGSESFERIDPALEAKEVLIIYNWFKDLSNNCLPSYANLSFIEPCISFSYLASKEGDVRIAINLSHELKPEFKLNQFQSDTHNWNIIFELNNEDFANVLSGLNKAIEMCPIRDKT